MEPAAQLLDGGPLRGIDVVDAHAHVGPFPAFFIPDPDATTMLRIMDRCGVALSCVSAHRAIAADTVGGNAETVDVVRRFPGRFLGYLTLNPHQDPQAVLERFCDDPAFVGLKLHPDLHSYPVSGERYDVAFQFAGLRGWPVLVHAFDGSPYDDPEQFAVVAGRHPGVPIMVGHAGATPAGVDKAAAVARRHDNLHLEMSGSWMTGRRLARLVDEVGADRVLFGSDQPFIDLRYALGRTVFAPLTDEARAAVLGANARRLLDTPTPRVTLPRHRTVTHPVIDPRGTR